MGKMLSILKTISFVLLTALLTFIFIEKVGNHFKRMENERPLHSETAFSKYSIQLVALGDSLTQGIGDSSNRGGYVPFVAENLRQSDKVKKVSTHNFGKSGYTSLQIIQKIEDEEEIQTSLSEATFITLSAGGNDLIKSIKKSGFRINPVQLEKEIDKYEESITNLIQTIRRFNTDAPLFLFGIYNPYEDALGDIPFLKEMVDQWNAVSKKTTIEEENVYFIPLSELFKQHQNITVSGEEAETIDGFSTQKDEHPYLFEEDYFHPNEKGYKLMADELTKEILQMINKDKGGQTRANSQ